MKNIPCLSLILIILFIYGCDAVQLSEKEYSFSGSSITASELKKQVENVRLNSKERAAEKHFHDISKEVPGFGGFYIDNNGNHVMFLTKDAPQGFARSLAAQKIRLQKHNSFNEESIFIKIGNYGFDELATWRNLISSFALSNDDLDFVLSSDVDESQNTLTIGIDEHRYTEANLELVINFINRDLNIPLEAITFTKEVPLVPDKGYNAIGYLPGDLKSKVRPLVGGLEINRGSGINDPRCTMGFIAKQNDQNLFITNSHCTKNTFDSDNTTFFQGFASAENIVGSEFKDPGTYFCGILTPLARCRKSDAAAITINNDVSHSRGLIARTTFKNNGNGNGSITIDSNRPTFSIAKSSDYIAQNKVVSKIGKTSGWTEGKITKTCIDKRYPTDYFWILECQFGASYNASGGDSGAPVFRLIYSADGTEYISLYGIHYGRSSSTSYFSPMSGIRSDLGYLSADDPNSDYTPPDPYNGGGGPVVDDPCETDPLGCHQQ